LIQVPNAAVNFTTSRGVRLSPGLPPMVPRIPEIDLISATKIVIDWRLQIYSN
jgi:hypothetical protein